MCRSVSLNQSISFHDALRMKVDFRLLSAVRSIRSDKSLEFRVVA